LDAGFVSELYAESQAAQLSCTLQEFEQMLLRVATRRPQESSPAEYLRSLHLDELALAQACAQGSAAAWERFLELYCAPLKQAAIAITKSLSLGEELADSLYAELYGLSEREGERRSPLASYSGRGSLMGWLRATLAQRHVDRFRRTRREDPMEDQDFAAPSADSSGTNDATRLRLESAILFALKEQDAEARFLLAAYFLDERTLMDIARLLRVHEATVSRKLKRLTDAVRKSIVRELQRRGLSRAAAFEALGSDPRDLTLNLRKILQTSTGPPFLDQRVHQEPTKTSPSIMQNE